MSAPTTEDWRRVSMLLEQMTGYDSIPTIEDHYANDSGILVCVWPGCSFSRRDSLKMWKHVHFGAHGRSFKAPFDYAVLCALTVGMSRCGTTPAAPTSSTDPEPTRRIDGAGTGVAVGTPQPPAAAPPSDYLCWCDGTACNGRTDTEYGLCRECSQLGHAPLPPLPFSLVEDEPSGSVRQPAPYSAPPAAPGVNAAIIREGCPEPADFGDGAWWV